MAQGEKKSAGLGDAMNLAGSTGASGSTSAPGEGEFQPRAKGMRPDLDQKTAKMETVGILVTIFGGLLLAVVPAGIAIALSAWAPGTLGGIAAAATMIGGLAVASTGFRFFFPQVPIWQKAESGEQFLVNRSMTTRRVMFGVALALYGFGAVATFFSA